MIVQDLIIHTGFLMYVRFNFGWGLHLLIKKVVVPVTLNTANLVEDYVITTFHNIIFYLINIPVYYFSFDYTVLIYRIINTEIFDIF